jgi:hypothetical protein
VARSPQHRTTAWCYELATLLTRCCPDLPIIVMAERSKRGVSRRGHLRGSRCCRPISPKGSCATRFRRDPVAASNTSDFRRNRIPAS